MNGSGKKVNQAEFPVKWLFLMSTLTYFQNKLIFPLILQSRSLWWSGMFLQKIANKQNCLYDGDVYLQFRVWCQNKVTQACMCMHGETKKKQYTSAIMCKLSSNTYITVQHLQMCTWQTHLPPKLPEDNLYIKIWIYLCICSYYT